MNSPCPHCGAPLPDALDAFCPVCREPLDTPLAEGQAVVPVAAVAQSQPGRSDGREQTPPERIDLLEQRISRLERRLRQSQLYSESFVTRAFAVFGHVFVAQWYIVMLVIMLVTFFELISRD